MDALEPHYDPGREEKYFFLRWAFSRKAKGAPRQGTTVGKGTWLIEPGWIRAGIVAPIPNQFQKGSLMLKKERRINGIATNSPRSIWRSIIPGIILIIIIIPSSLNWGIILSSSSSRSSWKSSSKNINKRRNHIREVDSVLFIEDQIPGGIALRSSGYRVHPRTTQKKIRLFLLNQHQ